MHLLSVSCWKILLVSANISKVDLLGSFNEEGVV